jgi:hypothetical protein
MVRPQFTSADLPHALCTKSLQSDLRKGIFLMQKVRLCHESDSSLRFYLVLCMLALSRNPVERRCCPLAMALAASARNAIFRGPGRALEAVANLQHTKQLYFGANGSTGHIFAGTRAVAVT